MFLFNVQPLNPDINSFIVHIRPSNRRKGDIKIIEILNHITNIEKKNDIQTISCSTDEPLMISGLLHILKRARYHFIPNIFNIDEIISLLNLPSMTLRSD